MLISLTHPVTPEVTLDPKLPIRPVTFDLKPEVPTTRTDELNYLRVLFGQKWRYKEN